MAANFRGEDVILAGGWVMGVKNLETIDMYV